MPRRRPSTPTMADLAERDENDYAVPRDRSEEIRRVREAFQANLGRDAGSDESVLADHLRGDVYRSGGIDAVLESIRNSEEARGRMSPRTSGPDGQALYGTTPYTDRGSGRGAAGWEYGGYDFEQDPANRQIGESAKYTMAEAQRLAQAAGATDSWRTKEGAADFANQHLKKYLEDNGFEVLDIVGDKIKMRDWEDRAAGREGSWVDWVIGAGGPGAKLGWQVEQSQEAFGAPETYVPEGFTPTQGGPPTGAKGPIVPGMRDPNLIRPQVQDRWGRSPNHPNYGLPPQPGETHPDGSPVVEVAPGPYPPVTGPGVNPDAYRPLVPTMDNLAYPLP